MKKKIFLALALTLLFIIGGKLSIGYMAGIQAQAKTVGTVTGTVLNVRTGVGTDKEILKVNGTNVALKQGETVEVLKEKDGWYQVKFTFQGEKATGWVSGDYLKVTEEKDTDEKDSEITDSSRDPETTESLQTADSRIVTEQISAKVTADTLNVRKTASEKGKQLTANGAKVVLKKGKAVKILKEKIAGDKKWYYITFTYKNKKQKGYVLSDYVRVSFSKNASAVTRAKVKLRKAAGSDKPYLKSGKTTVSLAKNTKITVIKETTDKKGNKWFKIVFSYKGKIMFGYMEADDAKLTGMVYKTGSVTATVLNVRKTAGTKADRLSSGGNYVTLEKGDLVTILLTKTAEGVTWYKISFPYGKKTLKGYVSGQYISIGTADDFALPEDEKEEEEPSDTQKPDDTESPDGEPEPEPTEKPGDNTAPEPIPDGEFDSYLNQQGFPDSYKEPLRKLHQEHPNWIFRAYQTGLDWNTVMERETAVGLNLISKNKTNGWLSYEAGAYNYSTDSFVVFDGSSWVTASKAAVAYYMDPRNFLFQNSIFQFEALEFQPQYQVQSGVETILKNTPMAGVSFDYLDEETGEDVTVAYSKAFMDAAEASKVSPYHLAARAKQEVIKNSTTYSDSVTGTFGGYEGYYNFYNIGASNSTKTGGAIANALDFAAGNTISGAASRLNYMLPWDNRYKAIVGGGKYIGTNYINRGQNTIYLQKFNVTPTSTFAHQYMANVEAANSEAAKTYTAYNGMGLLDTALVFNIPVYHNMPAEPAVVPTTVKNPNNWLKTLTIENYGISPAFQASDGGSKPYSVIVDDRETTSLNLRFSTASALSTVQVQVSQNGSTTSVAQSGACEIPLITGENIITILVTAENGDPNTYTITVTKTQ